MNHQASLFLFHYEQISSFHSRKAADRKPGGLRYTHFAS
jgi:hypothetical protein